MLRKPRTEHPLTSRLNPLLFLGLTLIFTSCINDQNSAPLTEGERLAGDEPLNLEETAGENTSGTDSAGSLQGGEDSSGAEALGAQEAGEMAIAGEAILGGEMNVAGEERPPDPPLPPPNASPCDRFCQRIEDCLYPRCEPIDQVPVDQVCRGWCRGAGDEWLDGGANLSCDDFTRRLYGFSPELGTLCEADPSVDTCELICDFGEICGLVSDQCPSNCSQSTQEAQLCFRSAAEANDCRRFAQCYQQGPPDDPQDNYDQVCTNLCEREANCVYDACAPGTVDSSAVSDCVSICLDERVPREVLFERYNRTCEEVVSDTLEADTVLAMRCETTEDQICSTLCAESVVSCGQVDQASCEQACETWDEANFYCLSRADGCDTLNQCFLDQADQARCRRSCDHLQGCLEEACPPRIIPPSLTDSCTADCFADPVSEEELIAWEMSDCLQVREVVYRDNQQLRPICEGNQDFRPSPAECSAFCDAGLDLCIIGDRTICLAACAGLTREQYLCALESQQDCASIENCLNE